MFSRFPSSAQVQHGVSAPLDEVTSSVARNGICLKGVIAVPEVGYSGELQNLNQNFRTELDLYANVVKVSGIKNHNISLERLFDTCYTKQFSLRKCRF